MAVLSADAYGHLDAGVRELCRALNATGAVETAWSCHGHPWRRLGLILHGERPYLVFDAAPAVAGALHERVWRAVA